MTEADFQLVREAQRSALQVIITADNLVKLGAADFSWLDKRVRAATGPCVAMLSEASNTPLAAGAVFMVLRAAQAIVRRDRLSEEQYEAFVGGFRKVGFDIPGWRDGWAASVGGNQ
ncbi:MAG: hypothetical protein FWF36_09535 [Propionibacteriaceae bacterium]|nr:hypothetical protein [Propionibacteriaceae bacterium]